MAYEPAKWYDDKADNPPRITELANIPFQAILEGYDYRHVRAIIVATDQYTEEALEPRAYFPNNAHRIGSRQLTR